MFKYMYVYVYDKHVLCIHITFCVLYVNNKIHSVLLQSHTIILYTVTLKIITLNCQNINISHI